MNSYEVLRDKHRVGHIISGVVLGYEIFENNGFASCHINIKTDSKYKSVIVKNCKIEDLAEKELPRRGANIDAIIKNVVDDTLYLSIEQNDFERVEQFHHFYTFIEKLDCGTIIKGRVVNIQVFGIFVDLNYPYLGLIDIGYVNNSTKSKKLPMDFMNQIQIGEYINCVVEYFRFDNMQIGLAWAFDQD